jgi:cell division protein FtsW (lipid II flippase)
MISATRPVTGNKAIRKDERSLLFIVVLTLITASVFFQLTMPSSYGVKLFIAAGVLTFAFGLVHAVMCFTDKRGDEFLFPLAAMLTVIGLIFIYRLEPALAARQFVWTLIGLAVYLSVVTLLRNYRCLEDYQYLYIILGLVFLAITVIVGTEIRGARSWLAFGSFSFQPSEPVKILMVIFLASFLQYHQELLTRGFYRYKGINFPAPQSIGPLLIVWGLSLLLLVFQRDLGTALIFFGTFLMMLYVATSRLSFVVLGIILFIIGATVSYFLFPHIQVRVAVWLNPWATIDGSGYQLVQSLFALSSGGFLGTGLGLGQPLLIPLVATDFIFAAVGEEMGLAGGIGIIILYLLLLYRGFKVSLTAPDRLGTLLAAGLIALFGLQVFVIIAGVIKMLPLTGITLPFMSYGGSSLVIHYLLLGLLSNISNYQRKLAYEG